jgi:hypothetical protein
MGTEPHFNLWNYFFRVRLRKGLGAKAVVWGCVDISIQFGQGIFPYFCLSMSNPPAGWQREWFFLRNDVDVSVPTFTGNYTTPQPSWGYGLARRDIHKL